MNNTLTKLLAVTALTFSAAPVSAAQSHYWTHSSQVNLDVTGSANDGFVGQLTPATVTFYANNPMASERTLETARLNVANGTEDDLRASLLPSAPSDAMWARVDTADGQSMLVQLADTHAIVRDEHGNS